MLRQLASLAIAVSTCERAFAQDEPSSTGWRLTLGGGALFAPTYEGDDSYSLSVLPDIQLAYRDAFFASYQNGVGYNWVNTPSMRAGPIGRVKFSRSEDGDQTFAVVGNETDDLLGLGDVDTSIELGGFFARRFGPVTANVEARRAVSGHEGFVADFSAAWSGRTSALGPPIIWSFGPRLRLVDDAYNEAYFGVDAAQAAASGLPTYEAGGGVLSFGAGGSAILPLTRDRAWSVVLIGGYDRLSGDAADSPLVQRRGSVDQFSAGAFLSYSFPLG